MLPRLSLIIGLLVLLALPAAAGAASNQSMTFEAPRELLDPSTRDRALDEIRAFGVDRIRVLVYWQRLRARSRRRRRSPPSTPPIPPPTRPGRGTRSTRSSPRRGARHRRPAHAHRPGAELGDRDEEATTSPSRARRSSRPSRPRSGAATATGSGCGRSGTSPTTRSSSSRSSCTRRRSRRASTASLFLAGQRGLPRVRQRRRHAAVRRDRAARHPARRRAARVPARRAVPQPHLPPQRPLRADRGRRLRPPRLHDARRPALPPAGQGRRDDRRALAALQRARPRPAGRARSRAGSAST